MAVVKVLEVISESKKGWDEAAQAAVTEAGKTVRGINALYVKEMKAVVKKNKIVAYRINANLTFLVDK